MQANFIGLDRVFVNIMHVLMKTKNYQHGHKINSERITEYLQFRTEKQITFLMNGKNVERQIAIIKA